MPETLGVSGRVLTLPNAMLPSADDLDGDLLRDLWEDSRVSGCN